MAQIVGQARENQLKAHLELANDKVAALEKEDREARITAAFNSMEHCRLNDLEDKLPNGPRAALIDWRIQIVKYLEQDVNKKTELYTKRANLFEEQFRFLLKKDRNEDDHSDLVDHFTDFSRLALRLWKDPTTIKVQGMPQLAAEDYLPGSPLVEYHHLSPSFKERRPQRLFAMVLTRPLIVSKPVAPEGKPQREVVWSKAVAWVSGDDVRTVQ
ncbi:hypothetical protein VCV18_011490 [Metarhizium anisopliae]